MRYLIHQNSYFSLTSPAHGHPGVLLLSFVQEEIDPKKWEDLSGVTVLRALPWGGRQSLRCQFPVASPWHQYLPSRGYCGLRLRSWKYLGVCFQRGIYFLQSLMSLSMNIPSHAPKWDHSAVRPLLSPGHCCTLHLMWGFAMTPPCLASVHYLSCFPSSTSCPGMLHSKLLECMIWHDMMIWWYDHESFLYFHRNPYFRVNYWELQPKAPSVVSFVLPCQCTHCRGEKTKY